MTPHTIHEKNSLGIVWPSKNPARRNYKLIQANFSSLFMPV